MSSLVIATASFCPALAYPSGQRDSVTRTVARSTLSLDPASAGSQIVVTVDLRVPREVFVHEVAYCRTD
jgi:hypothetical protein